MLPEVAITPDMINNQARKAVAIPPGSNRRERRRLERRDLKEPMIITEVHKLESVEMFEDDNLPALKEELREYEKAQSLTLLGMKWLRVYRMVDIPDAAIRAFYKHNLEWEEKEGASTKLWSYANPRRCQQQRGLMQNLKEEGRRILRDKKTVVDEEEREISIAFIGDTSIPVEDIYKEILRSRAERMDLIKLQIDWLNPPEEIQNTPIIEEEIIEQSAEKETDEQSLKMFEACQNPPDYCLAGWNLFWTKKPWSEEANYLVEIPTDSREIAVEFLSDLTRGIISIKTGSLVRALEFHLHRGVIQKALATRNRFGAEGVRNWVKIKRGRDRIFCLFSESEKKAVVFAGGRDVIYRS